MFDQPKFNLRTAAIIRQNDHVLIHRAESEDFWTLPGGRIELLEETGQTIRREMQEELGLTGQVKRLVFVVENFFTYCDVPYHELAFYYEMEFDSSAYIYHTNEPFVRDEFGVNLIFQWHTFAELAQIELYPAFLKDRLQNLPLALEHVVHRDLAH